MSSKSGNLMSQGMLERLNGSINETALGIAHRSETRDFEVRRKRDLYGRKVVKGYQGSMLANQNMAVPPSAGATQSKVKSDATPQRSIVPERPGAMNQPAPRHTFKEPPQRYNPLG